MELILRSDNENSIAKIVDLAAELNIAVEVHSNAITSVNREELKKRILNHKGSAESSFGDPLAWQLKEREDRDLPFRDR